MRDGTGSLKRDGAKIAIVGVGSLLLAACSMASAPTVQKTKEYFSQKTYGKASPVKVAAGRRVPKGGGYYRVGKPYRVAGKTYVPRDNPTYSATGLASWYGSAFHGRQTANGEIYDMNALTAAHPTLPLPSYARVTNLENGRSLVVRVNDRGPFARNRIIDVSQAVADKLDFRSQGTAKVRVDYVGPADLDGRDRKKLLASYSGPGKAARRGLLRAQPRGTTFQVATAPAPKLRSRYAVDATLWPTAVTGNPIVLIPAYTLAPDDLLAPLIMSGGYVQSFAPRDGVVTPSQAAAEELALGSRVPPAIIQIGSFSDPANVRRAAATMADYGLIETVKDSRRLTVVRLVTGPGISARAAIAAAADAGMRGAFQVLR